MWSQWDFDSHLPPEVKKRLRLTALYKRYIARRKRVTRRVLKLYAATGTLTDEAILLEVRELEALGEALFPVMERLQAEKR